MSSLTTLDGLATAEHRKLIDRAAELRRELELGVDHTGYLVGTTVANLFFEPSTRTQLSFDLAAQRLGAHVLNFNVAGSSTVKGESLRDTVETVAAIGADVLVVRHSVEGTPERVERWTGKSVINAGDGIRAHPTQALLDCVTLQQHFGALEGLRVAVVGDVAHSRVAASLARILGGLGVHMVQVGPEEFIRDDIGIPADADFERVLPTVDVVYLLRVQTERGGSVTPGYVSNYQLDLRRTEMMKPTGVVMHPGPVARSVEIEGSVLDQERSLVLDQVANGVPTRMAVLEWVAT